MQARLNYWDEDEGPKDSSTTCARLRRWRTTQGWSDQERVGVSERLAIGFI